MSSISFTRRVCSATAVLALLLSSSCTSPSSTSPTSKAESSAATPPPLAAIDYATAQDAVIALDQEIAAAGKDAAKLTPIATRLITLLREPGTTPAARQAISERLGVFVSSYPAVGDRISPAGCYAWYASPSC